MNELTKQDIKNYFNNLKCEDCPFDEECEIIFDNTKFDLCQCINKNFESLQDYE